VQVAAMRHRQRDCYRDGTCRGSRAFPDLRETDCRQTLPPLNYA
jgi:hypothetical protein